MKRHDRNFGGWVPAALLTAASCFSLFFSFLAARASAEKKPAMVPPHAARQSGARQVPVPAAGLLDMPIPCLSPHRSWFYCCIARYSNPSDTLGRSVRCMPQADGLTAAGTPLKQCPNCVDVQQMYLSVTSVNLMTLLQVRECSSQLRKGGHRQAGQHPVDTTGLSRSGAALLLPHALLSDADDDPCLMQWTKWGMLLLCVAGAPDKRWLRNSDVVVARPEAK